MASFQEATRRGREELEGAVQTDEGREWEAVGGEEGKSGGNERERECGFPFSSWQLSSARLRSSDNSVTCCQPTCTKLLRQSFDMENVYSNI